MSNQDMAGRIMAHAFHDEMEKISFKVALPLMAAPGSALLGAGAGALFAEPGSRGKGARRGALAGGALGASGVLPLAAHLQRRAGGRSLSKVYTDLLENMSKANTPEQAQKEMEAFTRIFAAEGTPAWKLQGGNVGTLVGGAGGGLSTKRKKGKKKTSSARGELEKLAAATYRRRG